MNKKVFFGTIAILLVFASCDKYKDVKLFVADFASAIEKGDTATIEQMYPDVTAADSLTITYNADSVFIEQSVTENQYEVKLNDEQSVIVEKVQEGQFHVLESKGLFAYDAKLKEFYLALGCYDPTLSDKENAVRMSDSLFLEYLNNYIAQEKILPRISLEDKEHAPENLLNVKYTILVKNETQFDLPKESFFIMSQLFWVSDMGNFLGKTYYFSDQDINKGESVVYDFPERHDGDLWYVKSKFFMKKLDLSMLQKIYTPTGYEYNKYMQISDEEKGEIVIFNNDYYTRFKHLNLSKEN